MRLLLLISVLLIFTAMGIIMFATIEGTSNPTIANFLESQFCQPGETVGQGSSYTSTREFRKSITFHCENESGDRRNITDSVVGVLILGFLVPFLPGIALFMISVGVLSRRMRPRRMQAGINMVQGMMGNMPSGTVVRVNDAQGTSATLSQRLKQLDDAHKNGLITDAEYMQTRQAILDDMAE